MARHSPAKRQGPEAGFKSLQSLWVTTVPRAVFPAGEADRVTGINITEKYNHALKMLQHNVMSLLNTYCVPGIYVSNL